MTIILGDYYSISVNHTTIYLCFFLGDLKLYGRKRSEIVLIKSEGTIQEFKNNTFS